MGTTEPSNKKRISQCREWERNRRNKFNDAITKLGEVVREINKTNLSQSKDNDSGKNDDNMKYPKIEIVQKAIICLYNCAQEQTQLRTEILALQVKLDGYKRDTKDASTQVHIEIHKKIKNGKNVKLVVMQKNRISNKKQEFIPLKKNKVEKAPPPKLPSILPRCNIFDKTGSDNAIVVLPAAPYIFPQRPLLFPTVPPAFVVVDNTLQTLNKSVPIVSRNSGDVTKTTMVNILPISAYSHPLSATKNKKNNVRLKSDASKKIVKKNKKVLSKITSEESKNSEELSSKSYTKVLNEDVKKVTTDKTNPIVILTNTTTDTVATSSINAVSPKDNINQTNTKTKILDSDTVKRNDDEPKADFVKPIEIPQSLNPKIVIQNALPVTTSSNENTNTIPSESAVKTKAIEMKSNKSSEDKSSPVEEKRKANKLPSLLESTLCDNVVDGGNARLELAEEFLAASPTAAFLMSFPLVSGNRADSPAEDLQNSHQPQTQPKDINQKRNELMSHHIHTTTTTGYIEKSNNADSKLNQKSISSKAVPLSKSTEQEKHFVATSKAPDVKSSVAMSNENPFLNLPMPSLITTNCTLSDTVFGLDFDCNISKPISSHPTTYASSNNIFYKNDPFSSVKNTIYSTSNISSSHELNSLGLYPCAMDKYTKYDAKNKTDFNMDDNNLMKIGSSRLTYDIDLGWSHKGFDFVNCTTTTGTFTKDNILSTVASTPFCTSYNPFTPDFHVPLVSSSTNKKDVGTNKVSSTFTDTLTNFYSQPTNLWSEEPFYTNANVSKTLSARSQNYLNLEHVHPNTNIKNNNVKQYEGKDTSASVNTLKSTNHSIGQQLNEKYTKKSPSKMHINWMTSEIRPMQSNNCNPTRPEVKEHHKLAYDNLGISKRHENNEGNTNNYFPLSMHNFTSQTPQEEFHVWPSTRPLGTTEISIDPPPINLPTLVGDLALGPHDKKKNLDSSGRTMPQQDIQNCNNFFSVTQLMNRSNDNSSRYQPSQIESSKSFPPKPNISHYPHDTRKMMPPRVESHISQSYVFNDPKLAHSYENMGQFTQMKKSNSKPDKSAKTQKNNYSAEALLRGGNFTPKIPDNNKFLPHSQKYSDFNSVQDNSVAQVSHFPAIIDYTENTYTCQQFSGTSIYNTATNTISNSFYSNFMPGSSNLMSSNYASGHFPGEFIDYNQSAECNYNNHKYEDLNLKMRNNPPTFPTEKVSYKSSRKESATKHKLEYSKKESNKKYHSKRTKISNEVEEWNESSHSLWQNKASSRKQPNLISEELPFPNYVSNQMPSQYQPDIFNSHLMSSNMQPMGHNVDRSITSLPNTSRANFNLSTIFPEITMKVQ